MDADSRLAAAQHQLDLILSFYGRVDAKLSVVLGIDLAMLGVFFTKVALAKSLPFVVLASGIVFCFLMFGSLLQLFRGSFPDLNGGHSSLVYFSRNCEAARVRISRFLWRSDRGQVGRRLLGAVVAKCQDTHDEV